MSRKTFEVKRRFLLRINLLRDCLTYHIGGNMAQATYKNPIGIQTELIMALLEKGTKAPDFTLDTDKSETFTLSAHQNRPVVLFFYPKDDTPGCTTENIEFTALKDEFAAADTLVIGISPDSVEDHCKFRDKHKLGVTLVADPDHKAIKAYGAWGEKNNYGKKYMGLIRSTFLIDKNGVIAEAWKVSRTKGHAAKVLEAAKALA